MLLNSHVCADRLDTSVFLISGRMKRRCLVVVPVCVVTGCSSSEAQDEFCWELYRLHLSVRSKDVVVVPGDFNGQLIAVGTEVALSCFVWSQTCSGEQDFVKKAIYVRH